MKKTEDKPGTAAEAEAEAPAQGLTLVQPGAGEVGQAIDLSEDADAGFETVGARDMAVPFYVILQKGSPQVDEASDKFIEGAKAGMIMNSVTGELFDGKDGATFIPCGFKKALVEWKDRDSGGGLIGQVSENNPILKQCTRNAKNQLTTPDGNLIIDTAYHFVIHLRQNGDYDWGIIGMSSTQMKASRNWVLAMRSIKLKKADGTSFTPAMFSHMYRMTTVPQSKDKYNWWGWKIENAGLIDNKSLYAAARDFAKLIADGLIAVSAPPSELGTDEASKEEVPF